MDEHIMEMIRYKKYTYKTFLKTVIEPLNTKYEDIRYFRMVNSNFNTPRWEKNIPQSQFTTLYSEPFTPAYICMSGEDAIIFTLQYSKYILNSWASQDFSVYIQAAFKKNERMLAETSSRLYVSRLNIFSVIGEDKIPRLCSIG